MTIHIVEQGSPEWHALRVGKVTASRLGDVCGKRKDGKWRAERRDYMFELAFERLHGKPKQAYVTQEMLDGQLREPAARAEYELRRRCEVQQIGFVDHPTIAMSGASADGFVGEDGLIEIKCPKPSTHFDYYHAGVVPDDYVPQIDWNFACNPTRKWCDFISWHPEFPEHMALFVARLHRNDARIAENEAIVRAFLKEVDAIEAEFRATPTTRRNPLMQQLQASVEQLGAP